MAEGLNREQLEKEVHLCKQALMHAGPMHYRDLQKHIRKMEAQLKQYDRFQAAAEQGVE